MEDRAITLIRACAHVLVGDDKENEMNLILNFCVVVSAGAVTFKSSAVIFGSCQKFVRSWALLASLQSCTKGAALLNTSRSVFIRRIAPSCLKSTLTQDPAAGYTCHTWSETEWWVWSRTGSRSAPKQRLLWQRGCHNTLKLCGAGGPEATLKVLGDMPAQLLLWMLAVKDDSWGLIT